MRATITILTLLALAAPSTFANEPEDPFKPIGNIDVSNSWVRTGKKAQVTWNITYPIQVPDLIIPDPSGTIITKEELRVKMRVAGVAFQSGSTLLPVTFNAKIGSGPWQELFSGTSDQVRAGEYVYDQVVPAGTEIDFGAQGRRASGEYYDPRTTADANIAVTGLMNGDTPPAYAPAYNQGEIESFLTGLISYGNGNENAVVEIGPRDMIYLFECASDNPGDWWFDMQDLVVVVTYEQTTTAAAAGSPLISQNNGLTRSKRRGGRRSLSRPSLGFQPASEPAPGDGVRD